MSFASDVRGELARQPHHDICCARSELAAALLASGGISYRGRNRYSLSITATDAPVVRRYFAILKQFWGVIGQIRTLSADALNGLVRYQLIIPDESALMLLEELSLLDESALFGVRQLPREELVRFACCKKAFVRAAFLMCGAVNNPEKDYHWEISSPTEPFALFVIKLMNYFEIPVKNTCRKAKFMVYLKKAESISNMLTLLGAGSTVLTYENVRIKKEVSNQVNRQINCDQSNINRVVSASETQIQDILYIDSELGLNKLPKSLRDIAEVRLGNPATSLTGLGELFDPPLGKSCVNARLRKLTDIAQKLRSGEEVRL